MASFSFIFGLYKQTIQILQQLDVKKCHVYPVSIWLKDSNPQPLKHEASPITTRPGLSSFIFSYLFQTFIPICQSILLFCWPIQIFAFQDFILKYFRKRSYFQPLKNENLSNLIFVSFSNAQTQNANTIFLAMITKFWFLWSEALNGI